MLASSFLAATSTVTDSFIVQQLAAHPNHTAGTQILHCRQCSAAEASVPAPSSTSQGLGFVQHGRKRPPQILPRAGVEELYFGKRTSRGRSRGADASARQ